MPRKPIRVAEHADIRHARLFKGETPLVAVVTRRGTAKMLAPLSLRTVRDVKGVHGVEEHFLYTIRDTGVENCSVAFVSTHAIYYYFGGCARTVQTLEEKTGERESAIEEAFRAWDEPAWVAHIAGVCSVAHDGLRLYATRNA